MKHKRQIWIRILYKFLGCFSFLILFVTGCTSSILPFKPSVISSQQTEGQGGVKNELIADGTKVDDLNLSGIPAAEVHLKINEWAKDKLEETRLLVYNNTEIPVSLNDLGIALDNQKTIEEMGRNPGRVQPSVLKADTAQISQDLQEKLAKLGRPAKDASYKIENNKVVITPAENGEMVDVDQMIRDIQKLPLSKVPNHINVPLVDVPATVTTESINSLAFDNVIGECTTNYNPGEKNRSANLAAAAKALDCKVLRPGEIFSFNGTVGPREAGTGYKDAYVIINGEYVQGTGGGVCQVSSTLYNAVLLSNLGVVERMPHEVAVNYVPAGQDATVNYPNIDFKFKNTSDGLLYLRSEAAAGKLTIRIWGKKADKTVRLERQVEKVKNYKTERRLDPSLPVGRVKLEQKGTKGIVVSTWRVIRDSQGNETKEFLSRDSYAPANRILRVGS